MRRVIGFMSSSLRRCRRHLFLLQAGAPGRSWGSFCCTGGASLRGQFLARFEAWGLGVSRTWPQNALVTHWVWRTMSYRLADIVRILRAGANGLVL